MVEGLEALGLLPDSVERVCDETVVTLGTGTPLSLGVGLGLGFNPGSSF
jgi:hypothetical protein